MNILAGCTTTKFWGDIVISVDSTPVGGDVKLAKQLFLGDDNSGVTLALHRSGAVSMVCPTRKRTGAAVRVAWRDARRGRSFFLGSGLGRGL